MASLIYFTRCAGEVVEIPSIEYSAFNADDARTVAYSNQTRFISYSRTHPVITLADLERMHSPCLLAYGRCSRPGCSDVHLPDRFIERNARPSLHACDVRCMFARGHQCECACGGKNHGAGERSASLFQENAA